MHIQFEIKETLTDLIHEILHSDKWLTLIKEEGVELRHIILKDPYFASEASVHIWKTEIHITTAWSNYTYRLYQRGDSVWCEYIGAYRGLLEQVLLPRITPCDNFLESEVSGSSLMEGGEVCTLLDYGKENAKQRQSREGNDDTNDHPKVVHDEFIKIGVPLPPR